MRTLGVSRNSTGKEPWCWSGPEGTCAPDQARLSASLVNAVSGPVRLDWSRSCVPLTRGLRIPWGILCGPLRVSGDSAGKIAWGSSGAEGACAPGQARVVFFPIYRSHRFHAIRLGRRCVPLTRGLRIPWGPLRVSGDHQLTLYKTLAFFFHF